MAFNSARVAALLVAFASMAGAASAQLTVFTDQAAWESAVLGLGLTPTTETFDGLSIFDMQPSDGLLPINGDFGITVTGADSGDADDAFIDAGQFHGEIFPLTEHASYDHVFNRPVRAFGQFFDGAASGLGIKISTPDGDIDIHDFYSGFEDGFLGFLSTNAYDRVRIIGSDADGGSEVGEIYEALDVSYASSGVLFGKSLRFQLVTNQGGVDVFFSETVDKVVDDQVEFESIAGLQFFEPNGPSSLRAVDVGFDITSSDSIVFDFSNAGSGRFSTRDFNGYVFSDAADNLPPIIGVSIDPSSTFGLTPEDILFTEDEIRIDVSGLSRSPSTTAILHLEFGPEIALPGDYNADGVVDAADYTVWRENVDGPAGVLPNDPNGGTIGDAQYATWKTHFGKTLTPNPTLSPATVPEPASVALLAFAAAAGLTRRRVGF
ncbi:hypothetical protein Pla123a_19990 [Posidoniimonas polymericola]|uniref:PEP-CTERM protein-sorting domain-containing protein n=1 Tax=Posidoniimonas polymericola TaxID=2528002 RepID=A0A5C5YR44_9BACT|nr:PEP-CTERM sorting domain-containing protein [Posidoniimonas polymericola]TWT77339.1 hypothetical protein Pla123a_19990 [Posidoniimonas polymericola]